MTVCKGITDDSYAYLTWAVTHDGRTLSGKTRSGWRRYRQIKAAKSQLLLAEKFAPLLEEFARTEASKILNDSSHPRNAAVRLDLELIRQRLVNLESETRAMADKKRTKSTEHPMMKESR